MNWYLAVLKNYAGFTGRARRKEYWMFVLFNVIFSFLAIIIDNVVGATIAGLPYGMFYLLYALAVFIPGLAVSVRRLHDIGKSGWMFLIGLIPIVGGIILIIFFATEGQPGENQYGPNPKGNIDTNRFSPGPGNDEEVLDENEYGVTSGQYGITQKTVTTDTIIMAIIAWLLISNSFWSFIQFFGTDFYSSPWFEFVSGIIRFIWLFVPLGLAFTITGKDKRTIAFVLAGLYMLSGVYSFVQLIF